MNLNEANALFYKKTTQTPPVFPVNQHNIYGHLVLENMMEVINYVFKGTGHYVSASVFRNWQCDFLKNKGSLSRFYYEIPFFFWDFIKNQNFTNLPSDWQTLAQYEITRWALIQKPNRPWPKEADLNQPLNQVYYKLNSDHALIKTDWAVDLYVNDLEACHSAQKNERHLLLIRHPVDRTVIVVALNPASFEFVRWAKNHASKNLNDLILEFTSLNESASLSSQDILGFIQESLKLKIATIVDTE